MLLTIPNTPLPSTYRLIEARYDPAANVCPACGGLGWPWGGWFHCDSSDRACGCIAVIADGRAFLPESA